MDDSTEKVIRLVDGDPAGAALLSAISREIEQLARQMRRSGLARPDKTQQRLQALLAAAALAGQVLEPTRSGELNHDDHPPATGLYL